MNRLEDSLLLWQSVTANKLLAKVNIVLFLNKCDLLQVRIQTPWDSGLRVVIQSKMRCVLIASIYP